jgi:hypothetical protein
MEDASMLEGSQGLFEEISFTIYPNGLSEDRLREVRDASGPLGIATNAPYRSSMQFKVRAERLYPSMRPRAASKT